MKRRAVLQFLSSLPLLGWLAPEKASPAPAAVPLEEDYQFIMISVVDDPVDPRTRLQ
jgi:hypothetical protein